MTREQFIETILGRPLRDVDKEYLKAVDKAKKEGKPLVYLNHLRNRL